ncbi:hypothetical protein AGMMS50230_08200 [Spirochaetia bacterium]|nr:hypothetical protein AGMMS50230_08200 [Spirochaetia bacterium]
MKNNRRILFVFQLWLLFGFMGILHAQTGNLTEKYTTLGRSFDWHGVIKVESRASEFAEKIQHNDMSWLSLVDFCLWSSSLGCPEAEPAKHVYYRNLIIKSIIEIKEVSSGMDNEALGAYILTYIYERFLREYDENQSRLDVALTKGTYNCISSAILYMLLAGAVGLDVQGGHTISHGYIILKTEAGIIDVETTNKKGFYPTHISQESLYKPFKEYKAWEIISPLAMTFNIFCNRIGELEKKNKFEDALYLIANWAAAAAGQKSLYYSDPGELFLNRLLILSDALVDSGKEAEALELLEYTAFLYRDNEQWRHSVGFIIDNDLVRRINAHNETRETADDMLAILDKAFASSFLDSKRVEALKKTIIRNVFITILEEEGSAAAAAYISSMFRRYGNITILEEIYAEFVK